MKLTILLLLFISMSIPVFPQSKFSVAFAQSAADDWRQGQTRSFEFVLGADIKYNFHIDTFAFAWSLKANMGCMYEKREEYDDFFLLPTDNDFYSELTVKYPIGFVVDPFFSANIKTQITESFKIYNKVRTRTAHFRDPITTQQSLGFTLGWRDKSEFANTRMGVSLKQIRADNFTALTDDYTTYNIKEKYKSETGISIKSQANLLLDSSIVLKPTLDLFSEFKDLETWTVCLENELQVNLWRVFALILKFSLNYDRKQSLELQYRESSRIGAIINF